MPPELVEALGLKSYVAFPLLAEARALGLVLCSHTTAPRHWSNEERQLVEQLALEGSLVVENAALRATEQERLDELAHQAFHDSLTELPNRALFADRLGLALARTNRRKAAVAVLFLDLDDFKPINDRFGHDAGDRLLRAVAERVRACVRPEDTVARLGGDEFTCCSRTSSTSGTRSASPSASRRRCASRSRSTGTRRPSRPASGSRSAAAGRRRPRT